MNSPKEQDCVLLTLTKDNKIERVRHCTHSDDKLRDYFDAIIAKFKNDFYAMKDIWVLKMVFTDKSRIPDIAIMAAISPDTSEMAEAAIASRLATTLETSPFKRYNKSPLWYLDITL